MVQRLEYSYLVQVDPYVLIADAKKNGDFVQMYAKNGLENRP